MCAALVLLLAYARAGWLPERPELLLCTAHTPWEAIETLIARAVHSGSHGRGMRLVAIGAADRLPAELQRRLVEALQGKPISCPARCRVQTLNHCNL